MDNRKIIVTSYLTAAGLIWFLSRSFVQWGYTTFYQIRRLPGIQFLREGAPFLVFATVFLILMKHKRINEVIEEVVQELKKVTWPSREDVIKSTWVVMVCIMIASFILAGFDLLWGKLIGLVL